MGATTGNTDPLMGGAANLTEVTFVNADGTTAKPIFTASSDGSMLKSINVTSDDTSTVLMNIYIDDGTTEYLVGAVNVVTLSGTDGTNPSVELLDGAKVPGLAGGIFIPSGYSINVAPNAAVTAAKTVTVVGIGVDY